METVYPVTLASESFPKPHPDSCTEPMTVVLRDFGPGAGCRYVTHIRDGNNKAHFWGHYFREEHLALAREDFTARCLRLRPDPVRSAA